MRRLSLKGELGTVAVVISPLRFYEKVMEVKADVAALHFFLRDQRSCDRWRGDRSRAPFFGVHLDP